MIKTTKTLLFYRSSKGRQNPQPPNVPCNVHEAIKRNNQPTRLFTFEEKSVSIFSGSIGKEVSCGAWVILIKNEACAF